ARATPPCVTPPPPSLASTLSRSVFYRPFIFPRRHPRSPLFPYTTLFRSALESRDFDAAREARGSSFATLSRLYAQLSQPPADLRSEEHTSELQSRFDLVCRLLLEKKT